MVVVLLYVYGGSAVIDGCKAVIYGCITVIDGCNAVIEVVVL